MRITKTPEIRKGELIEAAEVLFREQGYKQTSVNDIVKKVGVAQGTFYYYFKSKDDILNAVIEHYIDVYRRSLERLLSDESMSACRKIEIIANTALAMHKYDQNLFEFIHTEENLVTHQRYILKSFDIVIPLITRIVEQGKEAGIFDVAYPRESVEMLVYAFGYLEDRIAMSGDDERYYRMIQAAEDIMTRVLGVERGKLKFDPSEAANILQQIHAHAPLPEV
ncbi:MAG: transcriptional regulator BetI [Methanocella sp. PtaU1.Bin125]|nr:MAG: transcriptional regulator BetI [Methanocella sp. PtaU1.Bin125]